jgi:hypothetical protein
MPLEERLPYVYGDKPKEKWMEQLPQWWLDH